MLNLWCAEGVRAVKLGEVQRLRFPNPVIENEVRRALETLALSHDTQKKAVSLHFAGEGKRKVEVGYVIENPIWKTSYRLVLDKDGKPYLQGWAVVENPTDEDWAQGDDGPGQRPADLVQDGPVQPAVRRPADGRAGAVRQPAAADLRRGDGKPDAVRLTPATAPAPASRPAAGSAATDRTDAATAAADGAARELEPAVAAEPERSAKYADDVGQEAARKTWTSARACRASPPPSSLGDYFQYVIDRPVDLARQKSALLPIVNKDVEGKRVSIYNPAVQPSTRCSGLKFKNTTGMPLTQGPITVFEGSVYAGDTRVLDLQPDEERLVSYAIDLGTEVAVEAGQQHVADHQREGRQGHRLHATPFSARSGSTTSPTARRRTARC